MYGGAWDGFPILVFLLPKGRSKTMSGQLHIAKAALGELKRALNLCQVANGHQEHSVNLNYNYFNLLEH